MAGEFLGGFSKFFTNLTKSQRQEIDRALADLQNSKELTSLDTSIRLLKRKVDQNLPIPQLSITPTIQGAIVEWPALSDQRITFYEADISSFSNFASFTTVATFGIQVVIDGLTTTKFVRVRGVRRDGTTTPYSDQTAITPTLFQIKSHVLEAFYIPIIGTDDITVIGGTGTTLAYTPINPDGNSMVWGFIAAYADPVCAMEGDQPVEASVMVKTTQANGDVTDEEFVHLTFSEFYNSQNIGPFIIPHPDSGGTVEVRVTMKDVSTTEVGGLRAQDATIVNWCHMNILELGASN